MSGRLPPHLGDRLRLPVIAAPMLRVSGPDLVKAACAAGVVGAFPTANARTIAELDEWLDEIGAAATPATAPHAPNLIIRQPRMPRDLEVLVRHRAEVVITSVGSPAEVVGPLHEVGTLVLADVATLRHAHRAVEAGADGLVLLTAGAGGQTGWLNPFAFVRAVRAFFDGPLVLAGGIGDGRALLAARLLGCDLGYMGTSFIATAESMAAPDYKRMLVDSGIDDIVLTKAFTGLPTSMLAPAIRAAGLDPANLDEHVSPAEAAQLYGGGSPDLGPKRWVDVWSAGHSVSAVREIPTAAELVARTLREYDEARATAL
ncbi:nitronate monooxygenase [Pseudonocardia sp.]|uniref:NAD(P)H-dependent flavin oxidoreductase n=1 Tax=Pseudonocardia sp. TaxID=60912 RepID=UPI0031FBFC0D